MKIHLHVFFTHFLHVKFLYGEQKRTAHMLPSSLFDWEHLVSTARSCPYWTGMSI